MVQRILSWFAVTSCAAVSVAACVGDATVANDAGGVDATTDVGVDAAPDAGSDACTTCGASCVDLASDPSHCGTCSHVCAANADGGAAPACTDGHCANDVAEVSMGSYGACALLYDGSVWCWGSNQYAELGVLPSTNDATCSGSGSTAFHCRYAPTKVVGIDDAVQIAAGKGSVCAIRKNGSVSCWGRNEVGNLGHDTAADTAACTILDYGVIPNSPCNPTPTTVSGIPSNAIAAQIVAGSADYYMRTTTGDVYAWGQNLESNLGFLATGDGGAGVSFTARLVSGFNHDVTDIAASYDGFVLCAVRSDGTVWCNGQNGDGALGHANGTDGDNHAYCGYTPIATEGCNPVPKEVTIDGSSGSFKNVTHVVNGGYYPFSCALEGDGSVWCWGENYFTNLGNGAYDDWTGSTAGNWQPTRVSGVPTIAALSARGQTVFAIDGTGTVAAWGRNDYGQAATGQASTAQCGGSTVGCLASPTSVPLLKGARQISSSLTSGVALMANGTVVAWGADPDGELAHAAGTVTGDATCTSNVPCNPSPSVVKGLP